MEYTPQKKHIDLFSIESHCDLGITHFKNTHLSLE